MTLKKFIWICVKSILLPLLAILAVHHFNFFVGFNQITEDQAFDIGLACYLAVFEAIISLIENKIENQKAHIQIVFYNKQESYNENNCPVMVCSRTNGIGTIMCRIILDGNVKRLKKAKIEMGLSDWISSQSCEPYLVYENNYLRFNISDILPDGDTNHHTIEDFKIPFAINSGDTTLETTLRPRLISKTSLLISFESLGVRVKVR